MKKIKSFAVMALLMLAVSAFAQGKVPPMNGNFPRIAATAWHIFRIYNAGGAPKGNNASDNLVFCSISHFSYVPASGIGPEGNFRVQGSYLTLTNSSADHASTSYKMTWYPAQNVLKLEGGGVVFEMTYNGASTCKG